jgi:hypothetical protein
MSDPTDLRSILSPRPEAAGDLRNLLPNTRRDDEDDLRKYIRTPPPNDARYVLHC